MTPAPSSAEAPQRAARGRSAGTAALPLRPIDYLVAAYCTYYWSLLYLIPVFGTSGSREVYLALTGPILLLPLLGLRYLLCGIRRPAGVLLVGFGAAAAAVSIVHGDLATARTAATWVLPLLVLVGARPRIRLGFLNTLFLLSIPCAIALSELRYSVFGYIPDFSRSMAEGQAGWRVSLFTYIPESAYFALLVFIMNVFDGRRRLRYVVAAIAFYFVVFSGLRSAILGAMFALMVLGARRYLRFEDRPVYRLAGIALFAFALLAVSSMAIIRGLASLDIPWLHDLIFRGIDPDAAPEEALARVEIWRQHWNAFGRNPLAGIGTFDFASINESPLRVLQHSTGSESAMTGWLARIGIGAALLPLFLYLLHVDALRRRREAAYVASAIALGTLLTYSSLLVPYNLMFLLMFAVAASGGSRSASRPADGAGSTDMPDAVSRSEPVRSPAAADGDGIDLRTAAAALRQRWRILVAAAAAGMAVAALFTVFAPKRYVTEAAVTFTHRGAGAAVLPMPIESYAELAMAEPVLSEADAAVRAVDSSAPATGRTVEYSTRLSPSRDSNLRYLPVLHLRVEASSAERAKHAADAWADVVKRDREAAFAVPPPPSTPDALAALKESALVSSTLMDHEAIKKGFARLREELGKTLERPALLEADRLIAAIEEELAVAAAPGERLVALTFELERRIQAIPPQVEVAYAELPARPAGFPPMLTMAAGAVLALMLAAVYVILAA